MSKGYLMLAQNNKDNYIDQACTCAMSLHITNPGVKVSIVTNDDIPQKYQTLFDNIIKIPWTDNASQSKWKIENRWKLYHASPYDETVVLDTDMLVLQDISGWFNLLKNYELFVTDKVYDYRGNIITDDFYRKTFTANNLPNLYVGYHYFKKSNFAKEFYSWVELVSNNWELFYGNFAKKEYPKKQSMDLNFSIATKILDCEMQITNNTIKYPSFTHMKNRIQGWKTPKDTWQLKIGTYFTDDLQLFIGNHLQTGIFHYTEKDFLTNDIMKKYVKRLDL